MLRNITQHRSGFGASIPSAAAFQDATAAHWISNRGAGGAGTTSERGDTLSNGHIRIWIDADEDDGVWSFDVERVALYTVSHQAQAADLLRESIRTGRKTLWNCGVPVEIMFEAQNNMPGGRTVYQCGVRGRQQAGGRAPWFPSARTGWEELLRRGSTWVTMESVARSNLEGAD
jgi:hypothetical protein